MPSLKTDFLNQLKTIKMITKTNQTPTERELLLDGLVAYTKDKIYKQASARGFLAGAKYYKELILKQTVK